MIDNKYVQEGVISALLSVLMTSLQAVSVPVIVLVFVMIIDYVTGMISAWRSKELSSRKGVFGIIKKLCYIVAVSVGVVLDWVIYSGFVSMGVAWQAPISFGALVAIWLIIAELISILENLKKIGVPLPAFLIKLTKRLKISAENIVDLKEEKK